MSAQWSEILVADQSQQTTTTTTTYGLFEDEDGKAFSAALICIFEDDLDCLINALAGIGERWPWVIAQIPERQRTQIAQITAKHAGRTSPDPEREMETTNE